MYYKIYKFNTKTRYTLCLITDKKRGEGIIQKMHRTNDNSKYEYSAPLRNKHINKDKQQLQIMVG